MVIVLLMGLFLGIVSIGLWVYARSLLTSAAAQGARYAAASDVHDPQAASRRAADLIAGTLAGGAAASVRCTEPTLADPVMVEVRCTMDAPLTLPLLGSILPRIEITAHTLREVP